MIEKKAKLTRQLTGTVVSTKMDKTAVVKVGRVIKHKIYKKQYASSKKYKAHDEKGDVRVGDKVVIQQCRPMSKEKCWRIIKKVK